MTRFLAGRSLVAAVLVAALLGTASAADVIKLTSGAVLQGTILKRNDRTLWLDLGSDVLAIRLQDIDEIELADADAPVKTEAHWLFHTARDLTELSPKEQAKRVGPTVIKVATPRGLGSGVIISTDGHAITNAHVIQGETNLRVTVWLPQADTTLRRMVVQDIEIVAVNNHIDLALIKITHPQQGKFVFALLEAQESIEVGQTVFAIGNPMGLERTLSQGVISTTQRSFDGLTYIQTDAAVNPGNSGGPLFNTRGEVVGIINMGAMFFEGLNFAIPARYVKDFLRNREAFAYDKDNPNSGHHYHEPPGRKNFSVAPALKDRSNRSE